MVEDKKVDEIHKEIEEVSDKATESKPTPEEEFTIEEPTDEIQAIVIDARKTELLNIIDSETLKEDMQKWALVDGFVLDVIEKHPSKEVFLQYLKDQKELKEKIKLIGQQIQPLTNKQFKLVEQYSDNAKEMLEQIRML